MRVKLSLMTLLLSLAMLSLACGGGRAVSGGSKTKVKGDRERISHSEGVEPMWIQECPARTDHLLPFCGQTHKMVSEKMACSGATADAIGKLRRFIGQKVSAKLESDGQGGYHFSMAGTESEAVTIRGAWESERWAEEYEGGGRTHDCYVMITYPRIEYDRLVHKAKELAQQRAAKAGALHAEAKGLIEQGRHAEAATLLNRADQLLADIGDAVQLDGGTNTKLLHEQIKADLAIASKGAAEAGSTVLVVVSVTIDEKSHKGKYQKLIRNTVQKWLSAKGLKIRPGGLNKAQVEAVLGGDRQAAAQAAASKGAGLLMVVELNSEFRTKEEGTYHAYGSGELRFIRTSDGREIYTSELVEEKGSHPFNKKGSHDLALKNSLKRTVKQAVDAALGKI